MLRESKSPLKGGGGEAEGREAANLRGRLFINLRGSLVSPPEAPAKEATTRDRRQPRRAPRVRNRSLTSAQLGGFFSDDSGREAGPGYVPAALRDLIILE